MDAAYGIRVTAIRHMRIAAVLLDGLFEHESCPAILEHTRSSFDGRGDGGGEERVALMGGQVADVEAGGL